MALLSQTVASNLGLFAALLLGLRHATDPDHLTAVSSLVLGNRETGTRRAGVLGLAWGAGHATTLFAFGLPIVLFGQYLPDGVHRAAELAVGLVIVVLAARLLGRWRRGYYHSHVHAHDGITHAHPHVHETPRSAHDGSPHAHVHAEALGRSPLAAFGVGLIHGAGGSAGVGVLLVGAMAEPRVAVLALTIFAAGTAISMAAVSAIFGFAITRQAVARQFERLVPVFAVASLVFGVWYAWEAM